MIVIRDFEAKNDPLPPWGVGYDLICLPPGRNLSPIRILAIEREMICNPCARASGHLRRGQQIALRSPEIFAFRGYGIRSLNDRVGDIPVCICRQRALASFQNLFWPRRLPLSLSKRQREVSVDQRAWFWIARSTYGLLKRIFRFRALACNLYSRFNIRSSATNVRIDLRAGA